MEKEIISTENIKPSSPTPPHSRIHKLSFLDLLNPPIHVSLVLYFPPPLPLSEISLRDDAINGCDFISEITETLKGSLSATLTRYYPLAGILANDSASVDCNDEGVPFIVCRIKGNLSSFLNKHDSGDYCLHVPWELAPGLAGPGASIATIQVNYFDCGGIAIGALILHSVTDGVTICAFLKTWASFARGSSDDEALLFPSYTPGSLFPLNKASMDEEPNIRSTMYKYFKIGKTKPGRYVFSSSSISKLRDKLILQQGLEFRPSRVEIVSSLIWKCFMSALTTSANNSTKPNSVTTQSVNVRRKADPVFPENSFGNFVWLAPASSVNEIDLDLKDLVRNMRSAISKIDGDFVRRMQGNEGFSGYERNVEDTLKELHENAELLSFSSWCNFGLYEIDYGWGRPIWIARCAPKCDKEAPFFDLVWLTDTSEGDGIEAWVSLDEQYFEAFDKNKELRALAGVDPSLLDGAK